MGQTRLATVNFGEAEKKKEGEGKKEEKKGVKQAVSSKKNKDSRKMDGAVVLGATELVVLGGLTTGLLLFYQNPVLTPKAVSTIVGLSWFLGFSSVVLLPLDIAVPASRNGVIGAAWHALYWTTFLLAWVIEFEDKLRFSICFYIFLYTL